MEDIELLRKEIRRAAVDFMGMTSDKAESYANTLAAGITRGLITLESVIKWLIREYGK